MTSADTQPLIAKLRRSIDDGRAKPGSRLGSEHSLARETGMTRHSVRRAIEVLVSDGLVERVPGKGLFVSRSVPSAKTVQLVVGNLQWETMMNLARGAREAGRERGVHLQMYDAQGDFDQDLEFIRALPETQADGAIIGSLHNRRFAEVLFELKRQGYPFVLVDDLPDYLDVPALGTDNRAAGARIGYELIELGHRRIGFVGDLVAATTSDRLEGLRDALNDAGIAYDRTLAVDLEEENDRLGDWSVRVEQCTRQLMERSDVPTAIFFSCDAVAARAYPVLKGMGLSIPGDVSVVGFDDASLCGWLDPPLATMRQPMEQMGAAAMEVLLDQFKYSPEAVERRVLKSEWVPRASVGPAKRG